MLPPPLDTLTLFCTASNVWESPPKGTMVAFEKTDGNVAHAGGAKKATEQPGESPPSQSAVDPKEKRG